MQKGTVKPHAVIDHQQIAFERERTCSSKYDNPVCGCNDRRPGPTGNINTAMRCTRFAMIDALRPEQTADPPLCRPDKRLAPTVGLSVDASRRVDLREFARTARLEFGIRLRKA